MKKQTTALLISLAVVVLLAGLLIFLMVRFQSEGDQTRQNSAQSSEDETIHLLSLSSEDINTITIENPIDTFTLVNEGDQFVVEGFEEVAVSSLNINNLTASIADLTADREILSLSEESEAETIGDSAQKLSQYGLDQPQYILKIVTTEGTEEILTFGDDALDNNSIYVQYEDQVYLIDNAIADILAKDRYSFLDNQITDIEPEYEQATITLSGTVRPSPITLEIKTVQDEESESEDEGVVSSSEKEYTLTTPLEQTITEASASQMTDGLFSLYANSVEAVSPTEDELASYGLDQPYSIVTVWFDGIESFTLKASAPDRNNYVYLMKEGSPLVYLVSASRLSWLKVQTEQLTQSVYTPVEVTELSGFSVTSEDASYDFVVEHSENETKVSCNGQQVDTELFEDLYQTVTAIPPDKMSFKTSSLQTVLTMTIDYRDEQRTDDVIELIPTGDGSVLISINGESRYTASQDLVYQILGNCQNAVDGKEISNLA
ncbi:MAG: DUF4340 domain-containing protein [Clostridium sp.]|nr:DUF4340 domain-containing protein [Clostridium sp.]